LRTKFRNIFYLLIFILSASKISAQETIVVGQVLNIVDKSPIPDVNIFFKNTDIGIKSNADGVFMLRTTGKETTLVFSCVGYRRKEIKLKPGQGVGLQVELHEENTMLQEVFVVPGANPALELMKKVRLMKATNDVTRKSDYVAERKEQNLVLLSKINQRSVNKRIFEQISKGSVSPTDSSLTIPLYMSENTYELSTSGKKELSKNLFSSSKNTEKIILQLIGEIQTDLNFYDNTINLFGKGMISPLSNSGNAYYNFYLTDSLSTETGKQYQVHFRSKNPKNLAFNGKMYIDSATYALVRIEAELPRQANLNFIHNLSLSQSFESTVARQWNPAQGQIAMSLTYELLGDSLRPKPEIFVKRSFVSNSNKTSAIDTGNFAQSEYSANILNEKMIDLNETPILRFAKWLADVIITGYIPVGKFDVGKIQNFARLSDIEGLRLNLPVRTNEKMWKNFCLGGYAGYGFRSNEIKYSASAQLKLPGEKNKILGLSYTDDYRRVSYDYNEYYVRENPLNTGDEDITSTLISLRSASKLTGRKEFLTSFSFDWNDDLESIINLRSTTMAAAPALPLQSGGISYPDLKQQSLTIMGRLSFDERIYDDHFQRIHINNNMPVIYLTFEGGKYLLGNKTGNYAKVIGLAKQEFHFDIGQWNYLIEGGYLFGDLPYPLLEIPSGNETASAEAKDNQSIGYRRHQFTLMNYMEYVADKYISMHNELILNGIVLNQIPLIKHLNLREMVSFKMFYGTLRNSNNQVLDFPSFMQGTHTPYMEAGIGVSNIFRLFTLQSVWRLSDLNHQGTIPWGIRTSLRISF